MAKKKGIFKGTSILVLAGVIAVVISLYLTTGFPLQFIPVDADAQQDLLDDINNNPPQNFEIPIDCILVADCQDNFDEPTNPIDDILNECDQTPIPNTELILEECNDEVIDPITNMTVIVQPDGTVEDPPIMMPPEPEPELFELTISSIIFKTDNNGTRTESTTNFDIPLFAFFVEDTSNLDFDNGFIEQQLIVNAPPNTEINLDADFDILIANQTVLPEPLTISITGITDANGELSIDYVNPQGFKSKDFTFNFEDHVDKFPTTGTENVEFVLSNVKVSSGTFEFELGSVVIYSLTIARDPNQLIIMDEFGEKARVFPTDDTLRIYSARSSFTITPNCNPRRICSKPYTACCYPAPSMGGGKVTHILPDGGELIIAVFSGNSQSSSSITNLDIKIQRNEIYRVDFTSPTIASITFKTPMEQESYALYCKGISTTASTGARYCNFLQPSVQQAFADTLVTP